ncbi:hypothetical protein D3C76_1437230 [compost metagenome]
MMKPEACHTAAITRQYTTRSGSISQSRRKPSQPQSRNNLSRPMPGLSSHFQAVPVTIIDNAMGYR